MRALQGETLLTAWERCGQQQGLTRSLGLLLVAQAGGDSEEVAELPLAERNGLLLQLRAISFGTKLEGYCVCQECGAKLEFEMDCRELLKQQIPGQGQVWQESECEYRIRPATTNDLLNCLNAENQREAKSILLKRTVTMLHQDPDSAYTEPRPDWIARFEAVNASAEIRLEVRCTECEALSAVDLDIAEFLSTETMVAGKRLLADIHTLASTYGWSESAIAGMSNVRRQAYLSMIES